MKLTTVQRHFLLEIVKNGGSAKCNALSIEIGDKKADASTAIAFLNLVAHGALEGRDGMLHITNEGREFLRSE